jgi:acyl-CoA thioesterase-1
VDPAKGTVVAVPEVYATNLKRIVERLKQTGAKLIWVNTTPVPEGTLGRIKDDEIKYNETAAKVMADEGVTVLDLWAVAHQDQATIQRPKNVHYTNAGWDELGNAVSEEIKTVLKKDM